MVSINKIILEDLERITSEKIDWNRFSGKSILISGANGFLPAYMVETLLYLQYKKIIQDMRIIALVRNKSKAITRFSDYTNNNNLVFKVQDVSDPIQIDQKIDFIIHAASQASPRFYGSDPVGTLSANILGTANLLRLSQKNSIESFLYFSSSEVYGIVDEKFIPTREDYYGYLDPTNVRSCYAESKRMGENMCVSWFTQFGIPTKIVRPFHTYGPGMSLDDGRVYADFISDIVNNRDIIMSSDGTAKRSFCYLSDATSAFFKVLLNGKNGEAYNVGNPECEISIIDLARQLVYLFPEKNLKVVQSDNVKKSYLKSTVFRFCPELSKIKSIGWYPKINIAEGFLRTVLSYN